MQLHRILPIPPHHLARPLKERTREMRQRGLMRVLLLGTSIVRLPGEGRVDVGGVHLECELVRRGDVERREEDAVGRDRTPEEDFAGSEGVCEEVDCRNTPT